MTVRFVDFGAQYRAHREEYDEAIFKCLNEGKLILQHELEEFEENLAKRLGMKHAIGVANGTDALVIGLEAKGVLNKVLYVPGYTFKATMEAAFHAGNYVLVDDIDEHRLNTKVDIPVHIEGMVAHSPNAVIEDAAQAIGAKGVGYSGLFTLSFYPAKILGCFGDGGAILTNDDEIAEKCKLLRHHWQTNEDEKYAYNSRLDNVQAAFLNVKLKYLDEILARREEIAEKYKALEGYVGLPYYQEGRVWQDYVITTDNPQGLVDYLKERDIQTLGYGMTPPHEAFGGEEVLENVEKLYSTMLRLPCNETLGDEQIDYVIENVKGYFTK